MMVRDRVINLWLALELALIIYGLTGKQVNGTIITQPQDTIVFEGNTTVLSCLVKIDDVNQSQCEWTKGGVSVKVDQSVGKYSFIGDPTTGNCSLEISDASIEKDDDTWCCTIPTTAATGGDKSNPAKLTVYVKPSDPVIYDEGTATTSGGNISVKENKTETISCVVRHGNPVPGLFWTLDGQLLHPSDKDIIEQEDDKKTYKRIIYYINQFYRADNGKVLKCILTHITLNGTLPFVDATLSVLYGTTSVELLTPEYVIVDSGMPYTFSCKADGNPNPAYEWMFQSATVKSKIVSTSPDYQLAAASNENAGTYTCLAGNEGNFMPTAAVTFELRNKGITTAGIVGIVIGVVFILAIGVLIFLVIHLRTRLLKRETLVPMPHPEELNKTPPIRHNNTYQFHPSIQRTGTYMVPNEVAPLRPDSGEDFDRDNGSHVYMEPHLYFNLEPSRPPPRDMPPPIPKTSPPPRIQNAASYLELTTVSGDSIA